MTTEFDELLKSKIFGKELSSGELGASPFSLPNITLNGTSDMRNTLNGNSGLRKGSESPILRYEAITSNFKD